MKPSVAGSNVLSRFSTFNAALLGCLLALSPAFAQTIPPAPALVERPLVPVANDSPEERPSLHHVWIPGHWRWSQGAYVWITGRWEVPPVPHATWVPPQWQPHGAGYVLNEGYWQQNPPPDHARPSDEISTRQPPPPPRLDPIPESPAPGYVWQPGFWEWRDNDFRWVGGRWELPPRANAVWVPTHWETRDDRFLLVRGYWRDQGMVVQTPPPNGPAATAVAPAPQTVVVAQATPPPPIVVLQAPPPPQQEFVHVRPSSQHVWVPGFWAWRGDRYVWIAGHWARPPRGYSVWEPPRWERRGDQYVFVDGHWR